MSDGGVERRFRVDSLAADDAGNISVGGTVAGHLRVLRVPVDAEVFVFDGDGREARARVVSCGREEAVLEILEAVERDTESPLKITLVQAVPARVARMETIVRQVTELGVQRVLPVIAERSQFARGGSVLQRKAERWQRIADAAAEQCGRSRVPEVALPCRFVDLDWGSLDKPLFLAHPGAATGSPDAQPQQVTVMIGPEGGWTDSEATTAVEQGAQSWRMGPRVLRADTAGAVAVALLQQRWGDLAAL